MPSLTRDTKPARLLLIAAAAISLAGASAIAQDLQSSSSCVGGEVDAFDYAELGENFREGIWDKRAGVALVSESEQITLKVLDLNRASICENVADLRTRCDFSLRLGDNFSIRIDNSSGPLRARYRLCAY